MHQGGDYMVAAAYLSRGEGAVRDIDGQTYEESPDRYDSTYHYYYARDIEWHTAGSDLSNINAIKNRIMTDGAMATCACWNAEYMSECIRYQPPESFDDPTHAIAIVGWDDDKVTQAASPGAWLCKNSWRVVWCEDGYFWISYYDKHCGQHPEMGAVSFRNVERMVYGTIFYHDYHGWRATLTECSEAYNVFTPADGSWLRAVSFFTADDSIDFHVVVYTDRVSGELVGELSAKSGTMYHTGFHTVDLDAPLWLETEDTFYVYLELSAGGHPYDRTSDVPVLLGGDARTIVPSSASPDESYYRIGSDWHDLHEVDSTANFCIKGLCDGDSDGDEVYSYWDNCPFAYNTDQQDSDLDDVGDECDNCPLTPNSDQADSNSDGVGDACDTITVDADDIDNTRDLLPGFVLSQNYPNPFNPVTVIDYSLGKRCHVRVTVYDLLGRMVRTIVDEEQSSGSHFIAWDGTSDSGSRVASGVYFYRLKAGDVVRTKKMVLLR